MLNSLVKHPNPGISALALNSIPKLLINDLFLLASNSGILAINGT